MRRRLHPKPLAEDTTPEPATNPDVLRLQRRKVVFDLLAVGTPRGKLVEFLQGRDPTLSLAAANRLYREAIKEWEADVQADAQYQRSMQIHRLQNDLLRMRNGQNVDGSRRKDLNWNAIRQHERLLAEMTGTLVPVRVTILDADVAIKDALGTVLGNLTSDDIVLLAEGVEVLALPYESAAE